MSHIDDEVTRHRRRRAMAIEQRKKLRRKLREHEQKASRLRARVERLGERIDDAGRELRELGVEP